MRAYLALSGFKIENSVCGYPVSHHFIVPVVIHLAVGKPELPCWHLFKDSYAVTFGSTQSDLGK